MKLTKELIEQMANEVAQYCYEKGYGDVILYYNNKRRFIDYYGHERDEIQEDINPHDYMNYVAYDHILSISSEGGLDLEYEAFEEEKGIESIFEKYGCYSELGTSWCTSVYPNKSDMEVEYTYYGRPKERKYLHSYETYSDRRIVGLFEIYKDALKKSSKVGGSCIIGDGIEFDLDGNPYFFSTNYNQSDVSNEVIETCKIYLRGVGAENIYYNCGRLD